MTQYHHERSSTAAMDPKDLGSSKNINSLERDLKSLIDRVQQQHVEIQKLQTEMRRLKSKLDRHADHINNQDRG